VNLKRIYTDRRVRKVFTVLEKEPFSLLAFILVVLELCNYYLIISVAKCATMVTE
jgi:hypothetical protein